MELLWSVDWGKVNLRIFFALSEILVNIDKINSLQCWSESPKEEKPSKLVRCLKWLTFPALLENCSPKRHYLQKVELRVNSTKTSLELTIKYKLNFQPQCLEIHGMSSNSIVPTYSAKAWSRASVLYLFCRSVFFYSPPLCLSSLYLSFLLSSWLEYWWSSLWIWLSPRSAESDSRHKYLGASEWKTSRLKRTKCRSGFYLWWKSMWLDRSQSDSTCQL